MNRLPHPLYHMVVFTFFVLLGGCSTPAPRNNTAQDSGSGSIPGAPDAISSADSNPCNLHTTFPGDSTCVPASTGTVLHYGPASYDDPSQVAAFTIAPGDESLKCFSTPNPSMVDTWVAGYAGSERPGIHHLDVYSKGDAATPTPVACGALDTYMFTLQTPHEAFTFGDGAPEYAGSAFLVQGITKMYSFEVHSLNTSDVPELSEAWISLDLVPRPKVRLTGLGLLGGVSMNVVPHSKVTIVASAIAPRDFSIVGLRGHTHSHTTEERMSVNGTQVYSNTHWLEPQWAWFTSKTAPLAMKTWQTLSWQCDINNDSDAALRYNNQAYTGEMCNVVGLLAGQIWGGWLGSSQ